MKLRLLAAVALAAAGLGGAPGHATGHIDLDVHATFANGGSGTTYDTDLVCTATVSATNVARTETWCTLDGVQVAYGTSPTLIAQGTSSTIEEAPVEFCIYGLVTYRTLATESASDCETFQGGVNQATYADGAWVTTH